MDHSEVKHLPKVDHTPAELDGPSRCLLNTAAWLETHGLCQKGMFGDDGSGCVIHATWRSGFISDVVMAAQERLQSSLPAKVRGIVDWNENHGVTPTEVIAKIRAVALGL